MAVTGLPDARIRLILDTSQALTATQAGPPPGAGPGGTADVSVSAQIQRAAEEIAKERDATGKRTADQIKEGDKGSGAAATYLQYRGIDSVGRSFGRPRTGHVGRGRVSRVPVPLMRRAKASIDRAWQQASASGRQVAKAAGVGATGATVIPAVGAALYVAGAVGDEMEILGGLLEQAGVPGAAEFGTEARLMFGAIAGRHITTPLIRHLAAMFKDVPAAKANIAALYGHEPDQASFDTILQKKKWARERQDAIDDYLKRHKRFSKGTGVMRIFQEAWSEFTSLVQ